MGVLKLLSPAVAAAALAAANPALGQCRLCDKPSTALSQSSEDAALELEIQTSLNFDRLIIGSAGQGAAVLRPDGSTLSQGAVGMISPRAMVGTGVVHGEPGKVVRVELPRRIDLYSVSGGSRIAVDEVTSDLPSLPRLDSAGNLSFHFGGRVTITGDADGDYRGDLPITVEYQ
ncbi:MAG TPA: DUF4402 domain-containing protein [Sphingomicrobium sp.]|nr:DUF4402 domain-containing protein [Sphingomicrobium sp.]